MNEENTQMNGKSGEYRKECQRHRVSGCRGQAFAKAVTAAAGILFGIEINHRCFLPTVSYGFVHARGENIPYLCSPGIHLAQDICGPALAGEEE
ncbi:MAG: hypothetical protein KA801_10955 [Syntrophorhabdaceae bacterium]|nr:hypothetical protein [Syntrophorhabdaceae bacterium]